MYIEPLGLFFLLLGAASFGALVMSIVNKPERIVIVNPPNKNDNEPEWDIGPYSQAWWQREDTEDD